MIYLLSFILLFISTSFAEAHESWILSPQQIMQLSEAEPPALFTGVTYISLALLGFLIVIVSAAFKVESHYLGKFNQKIDKVLRPYVFEFAPLAIRLLMGFMLLYASIGALPRFGVNATGHATLFVPEFDLRLLGATGTEWLFISKIQFLVAVMLILGVYVRYAAIGLLGLTVFGLKAFGMPMLDYAPHFLAPALLLLYLGNGRHITSNLPAYNPVVEKAIKQAFSWKHLYPIILFLTGITFFYLGYSKKILNPNLIIAILEAFSFPNFGIPYDVLAMVMAVIEITGGILIAFGLFVRPLSLFLLGAIFTFTFFLNEPILFHGNIIALLCVMACAGNGGLAKYRQAHTRQAAHSRQYQRKHVPIQNRVPQMQSRTQRSSAHHSTAAQRPYQIPKYIIPNEIKNRSPQKSGTQFNYH